MPNEASRKRKLLPAEEPTTNTSCPTIFQLPWIRSSLPSSREKVSSVVVLKIRTFLKISPVLNKDDSGTAAVQVEAPTIFVLFHRELMHARLLAQPGPASSECGSRLDSRGGKKKDRGKEVTGKDKRLTKEQRRTSAATTMNKTTMVCIMQRGRHLKLLFVLLLRRLLLRLQIHSRLGGKSDVHLYLYAYTLTCTNE